MTAPPLPLVRSLGAMVGAQVLLPGLVSHFIPLVLRPLVAVSVAAIAMMALAAAGGTRRRTVAAVLISTPAAAALVYTWRRLIDPLAFLGSVPGAFEFNG